MNKQLIPLQQYIKLKYGGNGSEFAREFGIAPKNVYRLYPTHMVDMTNGKMYIEAKNQKKEGL